MVYVIATLVIDPAKEAAFLAGARDLISATRREDGCILYDLHRSVTDAATFTFVETWQSREALEAHFHTAHIAAWRQVSAPCLAKPASVTIMAPAKVETL